MKVLLIILGVAAIAGAVWFFTKSAAPVTTTDTKAATQTSGLLSGLNISGLIGNIFKPKASATPGDPGYDPYLDPSYDPFA